MSLCGHCLTQKGIALPQVAPTFRRLSWDTGAHSLSSIWDALALELLKLLNKASVTPALWLSFFHFSTLPSALPLGLNISLELSVLSINLLRASQGTQAK